MEQIKEQIKLLWAAVIWLILMVLGLFFIAVVPVHAGERPTLGQCMAASAVAGANHYQWQEKKFTREDCEAIIAPAPQAAEPVPKAAEVPADLQKSDPVEIHIHNPPPPAPVIIQKPAPQINIHIHNDGHPQSTLSDAPATDLHGHASTPSNYRKPDYDYHWTVPDYNPAAPGYWSMYSNGQKFFHQFHECTEYGAGCGY